MDEKDTRERRRVRLAVIIGSGLVVLLGVLAFLAQRP